MHVQWNPSKFSDDHQSIFEKISRSKGVYQEGSHYILENFFVLLYKLISKT